MLSKQKFPLILLYQSTKLYLFQDLTSFLQIGFFLSTKLHKSSRILALQQQIYAQSFSFLYFSSQQSQFQVPTTNHLLAQGQTQGSTLQQRTNKTLTTGPFGNTCEAGEVSPEVEAGGVTGLRCL
jgi:hypothetical protein